MRLLRRVTVPPRLSAFRAGGVERALCLGEPVAGGVERRLGPLQRCARLGQRVLCRRQPAPHFVKLPDRLPAPPRPVSHKTIIVGGRLCGRSRTGNWVLGELREFAAAATPERRLLMPRAAREAYSPGMDVTRMRAGLGDETARHGLIRWLARSGQPDELAERTESGSDYAQDWLAAVLRRRHGPHGR